MKHLLSLLTVLLFAVACSIPVAAETTPHFKFMGIPINGTISSFQNKLAAKGFKYDAAASKDSGPGTRRFNGMFSGNNASLVVFYNQKTKIVNDVKVIIPRYNDSSVESLYEELRSNLLFKYAGRCEHKDTDFDGERGTVINIFQDDTRIGSIVIYIQKTEYDSYWVAIEYVDAQNSQEERESKLEDL